MDSNQNFLRVVVGIHPTECSPEFALESPRVHLGDIQFAFERWNERRGVCVAACNVFQVKERVVLFLERHLCVSAGEQRLRSKRVSGESFQPRVHQYQGALGLSLGQCQLC